MSDRSTKSRVAYRVAVVLTAGLVAVIAAGWFLWPSAPDTIGPRNGSLSPCPSSPNCVHTGLRHPDGTQGMFIDGNLNRSEIMPGILEVLQAMPRTRIITSTETYVHAEVRSKLFRFIDDLELLVMPDRELVVRSASRVGRSDLGVNADRVAELRERLRSAGLIR